MKPGRLWFRLVFLDVVLLAALTVFVLFESWLVALNLEVEGFLTGTLELVLGCGRAVFWSVVVATGAVGVAGVLYARAENRPFWPFVALGVIFLVYALVIYCAGPDREAIERSRARPSPDLEQLLR